MSEKVDKFIQGFYANKDFYFGIITSIIVSIIMFPIIWHEARKPEVEIIESGELFFIPFENIPLIVYYLFIWISSITFLNYIRNFLGLFIRIMELVIQVLIQKISKKVE